MLTMIIQIAVAFVATVSFAVLFQVPKEQYVYSGICGAAGWWCYLLVMANYPSPTVSSFAAVVVLTIMARVFAVYRKTPVTVFLICGLFPLVPAQEFTTQPITLSWDTMIWQLPRESKQLRSQWQ